MHRGKPCAALGLPGGRVIVDFTAQMVMSLIDFNDSPQSIVSAPRIHTEGSEPIELANVPHDVIEELERRGHIVEAVPYLGGEANAAILDLETGRVDAAASGKPPGVFVF
jgi:gamma-glutamyltranspeptidase/glutathione hydrolase